MITNSIHLQVLKELKKYQNKINDPKSLWVKKYLGTNKKYYPISTANTLLLVKKIIDDKKLNQKEIISLINSLYQNATSYNELSVAASILSVSPVLLTNFNPYLLDNWLNYTYGWAEIDLLCQSNFDSSLLLGDWTTWKKLIKSFVKDKNISKRRASLVLLTKSLRQSDDIKLSKLAFENIEKLKHEKEILITKAISWLLRSLVKFHSKQLSIYLKENRDTLPKIAYREAYCKLTTGRKHNKVKKL